MVKSLDGCYTRMLRTAFNVSWRDHLTNKELYRNIPKVSAKVTSWRLQLAGHCFRHPELPAHSVLLWQPTHGNRGRGRPAATYPRMLLRDTEVETYEELRTLMGNREMWSDISGARPWPPWGKGLFQPPADFLETVLQLVANYSILCILCFACYDCCLFYTIVKINFQENWTET